MDGGTAIKLPTPKILAEVREGVGWLTFNQPERRNALSLEMWDGIAVAAEAFEADPDVRCVVMRGAGGKAFTAGADISEFEKVRADAAAQAEYHKRTSAGGSKLSALTKPLIAMIQGYCVGGGLAMALRADIRVASNESKFGVPAAKLGIAYNEEALERLTQLTGPAVAKEVLFLGRLYEAPEALAMRIINAAVDADQLEPTVVQMASEIARNAPLSMRSSKFVIGQFAIEGSRRDRAKIAELDRACFDSEDYKEGRRAFMEKRPPQFKGR